MLVSQVIARASRIAPLAVRAATATRAIINCCSPPVQLASLADSLRPPDLPVAARRDLDGAEVGIAFVIPLPAAGGGPAG